MSHWTKEDRDNLSDDLLIGVFLATLAVAVFSGVVWPFIVSAALLWLIGPSDTAMTRLGPTPPSSTTD